MDSLDMNATVGQWVAQYPQAAHLFEQLRIDYCCGGGNTLAQACAEKQLNVKETLDRLGEVMQQGSSEDEINWSRTTLSELCDDIEQTHHEYLRAELPRLSEIVANVVRAHGEAHPELAELQETFRQLCEELEPHMIREEQVLFPVIRLMEQSDIQLNPSFETVANPITVMEDDHSAVGVALERMRALTNGFRVPRDACNMYRVMIESLRQMEADLHQHIHKENNILFPRAQQLEANRGTAV